MKILVVEPYYTGSHAAWAEGFRSRSRNSVEILSLDGRFWKWRMHGGAVTLARRFNEKGLKPDLILATDMCDLTTFLSLTRRKTSHVPAAVYFHENQLTYPWQPDDRDLREGRDRHYGFINYASALAADRAYFNSRFHMEEFLSSLSGFLKGFPEHNEPGSVEAIREKSFVLYPGLDLKGLLPRGGVHIEKKDPASPPLILWNHRWEHDKNPEEFFRALYALAEKGLSFEVALLGESFSTKPTEFDRALERLGPRVVHTGYAEDRREYARWLRRADILPVTSVHDFFGLSVVEAIWSGCYPILPRRLAYPEHLPPGLHGEHYYDDFKGLVEKLEWAVKNIERVRSADLGGTVEGYDWSRMAPLYDSELEGLVSSWKDDGLRPPPGPSG